MQAHHEVYIAAIGGSVRVRPIPPALARQLEDRATKAGKLDLAELRMLKFFHGVAEPNFTMDEVRVIFAKYGPSVWLVLNRIDEISGTEQTSSMLTCLTCTARRSVARGRPGVRPRGVVSRRGSAVRVSGAECSQRFAAGHLHTIDGDCYFYLKLEIGDLTVLLMDATSQ